MSRVTENQVTKCSSKVVNEIQTERSDQLETYRQLKSQVLCGECFRNNWNQVLPIVNSSL